MLHIINGDAALAALSAAGIPADDILPWRDLLHEGPVPAGLTLDELSVVRAEFIADCGWGEQDELREAFRSRDCRLAGAQGEDEAVLWFESDLYDQLQLIQLLDWFADPTHRPAKLSLVQVDRQPQSGRFEALGRIAPERVRELMLSRNAVSGDQLHIGGQAWAAFRCRDPRELERVWHGDTGALPYLGDALLRMLEELPSAHNGLSRTEQSVLELLDANAYGRAELFVRVNARESRPFLGDSAFGRTLERLCAGARPLVVETSGKLVTLSEAGRAALAGELDALQTNGIDRWWGGTRLWHRDRVWRWDGALKQVV